jgi:hypothetical protein
MPIAKTASETGSGMANAALEEAISTRGGSEASVVAL